MKGLGIITNLLIMVIVSSAIFAGIFMFLSDMMANYGIPANNDYTRLTYLNQSFNNVNIMSKNLSTTVNRLVTGPNIYDSTIAISNSVVLTVASFGLMQNVLIGLFITVPEAGWIVGIILAIIAIILLVTIISQFTKMEI